MMHYKNGTTIMAQKISISIVRVYKSNFAINNTYKTKNVLLDINLLLDDNDTETQPNINIDNCLLMINKCDETDAYKPNRTDDVKIINNNLQVSDAFLYYIYITCLNKSKQHKSFQNHVQTFIDLYYCIF